MDEHVEEGAFDNLPPAIRELLEQHPLEVSAATDDEREVYARAERGRCMTCEGELKENTMAMVARQGTIFLACSGQCMTDMQVVGWIEEVHDDILSAVKFRGGGDADVPESEE